MVGGPFGGCPGFLPHSSPFVTLLGVSYPLFITSPIFSVIYLPWTSFTSCYSCRLVTSFSYLFLHLCLFSNCHLSGTLNNAHPVTMSISYSSLRPFCPSYLLFYVLPFWPSLSVICIYYIFLIFIKFIEMTLVSKIILVSSVQFSNTSSIYCVHHPESSSQETMVRCPEVNGNAVTICVLLGLRASSILV